MAEIMVDIHLFEASMNITTYSPNKPGQVIPPPDINILKKNNISKKQYDVSFDFYTQHPDMLNQVYELVLNNLSKMQAEVVNKK